MGDIATISGSAAAPAASQQEAAAERRGASSFIWLLPLPVYLGVIAAFLLPFLSVSCRSRETGALTGVDLLRGGEIEWVAAGPDDWNDSESDLQNRQNVEWAVEDFSLKARVAFGMTFAGAVLSVVLAAAGRSKGLLPVALLLVGIVTPLAYVPLFVGGFFEPFMSSAPSVHHYYGLYLAAGLAVLALVLILIALRVFLRGSLWHDALRGRVLGFGAILYIVLAVFILAMANGSYDEDPRWENTR